MWSAYEFIFYLVCVRGLLGWTGRYRGNFVEVSVIMFVANVHVLVTCQVCQTHLPKLPRARSTVRGSAVLGESAIR